MRPGVRVSGVVLLVLAAVTGCGSGPKVATATGIVTTVSPALCIGRAQAEGVCFLHERAKDVGPGDCVTVRFEGTIPSPRRLRSISAAKASDHAADCPASLGSVSGTFVRVGGPAPGAAAPLPGRVTFTSASMSFPVEVGPRGAFLVVLPAGRYQISGTSPLIQDGQSACPVPGELTVVAAAKAVVRVVCDIK